MMFGKKKPAQLSYDNGKYHDVMLIKSDADLIEFKRLYGVDEVKTIY